MKSRALSQQLFFPVLCFLFVASMGLSETRNEKGKPTLEEGFISLFDGKSLSGWHYAGNPGGYEITNGVLVCTPRGGNLFSDREFANFVLRLEFKLKPGGNNGIAIRAPDERPR